MSHASRPSRRSPLRPADTWFPPRQESTMSRSTISPPAAPSPAGAYSQAVAANGFVYTAGFGPHDPVTGQLGETIEEQTRSVLRSISAVLAEAGLDLSDVVKATVHLQDLDRDFAGFNAEYAAHFSAPYPVRTTVGSRLAGILGEIDVVGAQLRASPRPRPIRSRHWTPVWMPGA